MQNQNAQLFENLYSAFAKKEWQAFVDLCPETFTFQLAGKSKLAGKFTKTNFVSGYASKLQELSGGTLQTEIHDILVSDRHATILGTHRLVRDGKTIELRTVHVWRFENGKPTAAYEYPRDLYQYDLLFG